MARGNGKCLRLSVMEFSFLFCFPFPWCSSISRVLSAHGSPLLIESDIQILPLFQGMGKRRWLTPQTRLTVYLRYKTFSSTPVARYNRRFCLPKHTTPVYTQFSAALPLTWPRPLCKENSMWLRFLLLRNVSLSPVLFAVILVLLWVPKCCNWNCKARRKVSIVFVMDQLISKKLSLSPRSVDLSY